MIFHETELGGAYVIEPEMVWDERGFFARTFCRREFADHGLPTDFVQSSVSFNNLAFTLRGLHYEATPHNPAKLVRCTAGAVYDVLLDLRTDSPTHMGWTAVELSSENRKLVFVPKGFAHGFLTLTDGAEVTYDMTEFYVAGASRGVRWDEPVAAITWPQPPAVISDRDRTYPDYDPTGFTW